jgi:hypothetical protein
MTSSRARVMLKIPDVAIFEHGWINILAAGQFLHWQIPETLTVRPLLTCSAV